MVRKIVHRRVFSGNTETKDDERTTQKFTKDQNSSASSSKFQQQDNSKKSNSLDSVNATTAGFIKLAEELNSTHLDRSTQPEGPMSSELNNAKLATTLQEHRTHQESNSATVYKRDQETHLERQHNDKLETQVVRENTVQHSRNSPMKPSPSNHIGPVSEYYEYILRKRRNDDNTWERLQQERQKLYTFQPSTNQQSQHMCYEQRPRAGTSESIASWTEQQRNKVERCKYSQTESQALQANLISIDELLRLHQSRFENECLRIRDSMENNTASHSKPSHEISKEVFEIFLERNREFLVQKAFHRNEEHKKQLPKMLELLPEEVDQFISRCNKWADKRNSKLQKQRKEQEETILSECTFKPSVSCASANGPQDDKATTDDKSFFQRVKLKEQQRVAKIEKLRKEAQHAQDMKCTFQPQTSRHIPISSLQRAKMGHRDCSACRAKCGNSQSRSGQLCTCDPLIRESRRSRLQKKLKRPFTSSRIKYQWLQDESLMGRSCHKEPGTEGLPDDPELWNELEVDTAISRARVSRFLTQVADIDLSVLVQHVNS